MGLEIVHKEHAILGSPISFDVECEDEKDVDVPNASSSQSKL